MFPEDIAMKNNKKAFTLIELLVVVLIIGILAAIALPQYEKSVWKSRAAQLSQLTRSLATAQEVYFLTHGSYPTNFDELDFSFDALPNKPSSSLSAGWGVPSSNAIRANDDMELIINNGGQASDYYFSTGVFTKGKFKSCGFLYTHDSNGQYAPAGKKRFYCVEYSGTLPTQGDFCTKVMGISFSPVIVGGIRFFPVG
jgi:prepilin-type N-terminal cleavage/methylation domain-containing protein